MNIHIYVLKIFAIKKNSPIYSWLFIWRGICYIIRLLLVLLDTKMIILALLWCLIPLYMPIVRAIAFKSPKNQCKNKNRKNHKNRFLYRDLNRFKLVDLNRGDLNRTTLLQSSGPHGSINCSFHCVSATEWLHSFCGEQDRGREMSAVRFLKGT